MSEEIRNKIVPKLRFPEFKNTEGWEGKTLGNICFITNGKSNAQDHIEDGLYPLFDRSAVIKASNNFIFDCEVVIIPGEGMQFIPKYYIGKFDLHQRAYALKDFTCIGLFVYYLMVVRSKLLAEKAVQSTVLSLRLPILQNFPIQIPVNKREQQKIADCLSSLDDLITAQKQKIEALKTYKKGLMQQLFPAEGETVPKLRFAEFEDNGGDWEEATLDNVAIFLKGKGISKSDIDIKGNLPCIRYGELYTYYKEIIKSTISFTNLPAKDLVLSEINDVIIPSSGETQEDIATAACVMKSGIALGGDLNIIRSKINGVFLSYYLSHVKKSSIAKLAQGNAVVHLYISQLKNLKINFPKVKAEQQKIADCLSTLDESITAQKEKIEALKAHKKGLMQQLFPNNNE